MLIAAFDESGSHKGARCISIAGYVATADAWESLAKEWAAVLARAHLKYFHMTDFENRRKQFEGWSNADRIRIIQELADLIDRFTLLGFGISVDTEAYAKVFAPQVPEATGYRDPYLCCMQACMEQLFHAKRCTGVGLDISLSDPRPISSVFESGHSKEGRLSGYYDRFRDSWDAADVFGVFSTDTKGSFLPLQAADILAYETRKQIVNEGERPTRKSLERLCEKGRVYHGAFGEKELTAIVERVQSRPSERSPWISEVVTEGRGGENR